MVSLWWRLRGSKVGEGFREAGRRRGGGRRPVTQVPPSPPPSVNPSGAAPEPSGLGDPRSGHRGELDPAWPLPRWRWVQPLASAAVGLIKRTICLPLNQTQIPFPSNVPEASRDPDGPSPSRLHLLSWGLGSASSSLLCSGLGPGTAGGGREVDTATGWQTR